MLNVALVAVVSDPDVALSRYPTPVLLMLRELNVATPATAVAVVVPANVPPPGFVSMETVTSPVKSATTAPSASRASTTTAGATADPATTLVGSILNAN